MVNFSEVKVITIVSEEEAYLVREFFKNNPHLNEDSSGYVDEIPKWYNQYRKHGGICLNLNRGSKLTYAHKNFYSNVVPVTNITEIMAAKSHIYELW